MLWKCPALQLPSPQPQEVPAVAGQGLRERGQQVQVGPEHEGKRPKTADSTYKMYFIQRKPP